MRQGFKPKFIVWLVAGILLLGAGNVCSAEQSLINQTTFSPVRTLENTVRLAGKSARVPLAANDVGVGGDGVVWVASNHGVFRLRGAAWEQVPTASTMAYTASFSAAKRIDVDSAGTPWVIDADGVLLKRQDGQWAKLLTNVADVGVGKAAVWLLPTAESNLVKGMGDTTIVLSADMAGNIAVVPWQAGFGKPVAVTVDDGDVPHFATASGRMVKYAQGSWQEETVTCSVAGDKDCDTTRVFHDIAASNRAIWIAGTGQATGDVTFHYSAGALSGDRLFPALGPALKAVSADPLGNLYGINARNEVVFGEIGYDYQASGALLGAAMNAAFDAPFRHRMTAFDGAQPEIRIDIPEKPKGAAGYDYQTALDPTDDLTVSFSLYPPEAIDPAGEGGCILSYRSTKTNYLSICVDAAYEHITVSVGAQQESFPVQLSGEQFVNVGKQPYVAEDVGRKFVFRIELGEATLETVSAPMTVVNGMPKPASAAKFTTLGEMSMPAAQKIDKGGAQIYIASSDGAADRYRGYLGTVRIFDGAVKTKDLLLNWQNGEPATSLLPGYPGMLVEAVLNPENKTVAAMSAALMQPLDLGGFWYVTGKGDYYSREVDVDRHGPGTWGIDRVEVLKLNHVAQATAFSPQRLRIARDGEGGVVTTSFEQTGERTYKGWQDPLTKRLGAEPFQLTVMDANAVIVKNAATQTEYRLARVPAYKEVDPPLNQIDQTTMSFLGYDILAVSPYFELGGRKDNVFDTVERDESGAEVPRIGRQDRRVPWGLLYKRIDQGTALNQSRVMQSTRELQEDLRLSIGVSMEVPEVVSFSREAKFSRQVKTMSEQKTMKAIGEMYWAGHALILDPARARLDPAFTTAVKRARSELAESNATSSLRSLISAYGTHYTNSVIYGSRARSEKAISENAIERAVESQWDVDMKNSATIKGVKLGLDGSFGMGAKSEFRKSTENTDSKTNVSSGTTSFDTEEVMVGEDPERNTVIALDLRPLSELLSPVYFDDPYVYSELRLALSREIARYVGESEGMPGLSDQSLLPNVYAISIDKLVPNELGDGSVEGKISMFVRKPGETVETERVLWAEKATKPTDAENGEIIIAKNDFVSLLPVGSDLGSIRFEATLKGVNVAATLGKVGQEVPLKQLETLNQVVGNFTTIADGCQCVTACPEGYEDDEGQCLKTCPAGFDEHGATCYGVKYGDTYAAWDLAKCKSQHPTSGCDQHVLYVQEACPTNFTEAGFGICMPVCKKFGLDNWGGSRVTCARPETDRSNAGRSPNNQCPVGAAPGNDCSRVKIAYTVTRIKFEDRN